MLHSGALETIYFVQTLKRKSSYLRKITVLNFKKYRPQIGGSNARWVQQLRTTHTHIYIYTYKQGRIANLRLVASRNQSQMQLMWPVLDLQRAPGRNRRKSQMIEKYQNCH